VRASTAAIQLYDVPWRSTPTFAEWSTVTSEEVEKLIGSALNKTCQLDPAPTSLVKDMRGLLSPFISIAVQQITQYCTQSPKGVKRCKFIVYTYGITI